MGVITMSSVSERILMRMKELNLQQVDLIEATGLSKGTVSKWISGVNTPSGKSITSLSKALKTSPEWILDGIDRPLGSQQVEVWDEARLSGGDEVEIPFFEEFSFACGDGALNEQMVNAKKKLKVPRSTLRNLSIDKNNAVAAKASGDSMSPKIEDGDIIHIDVGRKTIKDGKTFVICLGGLNYAKKLYNMPFGGVRIVSNNAEEFPEIVLTKEEAEINQFEIIGWVWQVSKVDKW